MAITQQPALLHWNYFLALEADLGTLSRFVELTANNFATYSIEQVHDSTNFSEISGTIWQSRHNG